MMTAANQVYAVLQTLLMMTAEPMLSKRPILPITLAIYFLHNDNNK